MPKFKEGEQIQFQGGGGNPPTKCKEGQFVRGGGKDSHCFLFVCFFL